MRANSLTWQRVRHVRGFALHRDAAAVVCDRGTAPASRLHRAADVSCASQPACTAHALYGCRNYTVLPVRTSFSSCLMAYIEAPTPRHLSNEHINGTRWSLGQVAYYLSMDSTWTSRSPTVKHERQPIGTHLSTSSCSFAAAALFWTRSSRSATSADSASASARSVRLHAFWYSSCESISTVPAERGCMSTLACHNEHLCLYVW